MNINITANKKSFFERVLFIMVLCTALCLLPSASSALIGLEEGDVPKKIVLDDINGRPVNVTKYFGKRPVVIVFWELMLDKSFLNYSLDELRFLNGYYEKYHDSRGLEIFGIYTPEETEDIPERELDMVRDLITVNKIKFPVLIDRGFKVFREYGVIALPSTVMVGKNGKIKFIYPSFPLAARQLFSGQVEDLAGIARKSPEDETEKAEGRDSRSNRLYNYALRMYKKGLLEQAMSPLKKSIALDPQSARAHNLLGIILWKSHNFEGAMEEFITAIKKGRKNAAVHLNYGLLLFESGKYSEAEKQLEVSRAINDKIAETYYALGVLYRKTGRNDEAIEELKKAILLFEKDSMPAMVYDSSVFHRISACYVLSELHAANGEIKKALDLLQKAARAALGIDISTGRKPIFRSEDLMIHE